MSELREVRYAPKLNVPAVCCTRWRYTRRHIPSGYEGEVILVSNRLISEQEALVPINRWNRLGRGEWLYVLVGPYVEGE